MPTVVPLDDSPGAEVAAKEDDRADPNALLPSNRIITPDQIQTRLLKILSDMQVDGDLYLADHNGASLQFWYLGQKWDFLKRLPGLAVIALFDFENRPEPVRKRPNELQPYIEGQKFEQLKSVRLFEMQHVGGLMLNGRWNGAEIFFPVLDSEDNVYLSPVFSHLQMTVKPEEVAAAPRISMFGETFKALPNLAATEQAGVIPNEIDIVYTWVDGEDPLWLADKSRWEESYTSKVRDGNSIVRFKNREELRYSLRSVLMYFRGLRTIYIVTNGQRPSFISKSDSRIQFVDHREIFKDRMHLPTFNSHALEANLWRIDGLSKKFVYMNDDVFLGRTVTPYMFFDEYGRTRYFQSNFATIPSGEPSERESSGDAAAMNARRLIKTKFGVVINRKFKHTPLALNRDVMQQMEKEFPEEFTRTSAARFRSSQDVAISGSLYFHYATMIGKATHGPIKYYYFEINRPDFRDVLRNKLFAKSETDRLDAYCINDVLPTRYTSENETALHAILEKAFPIPAPWEA